MQNSFASPELSMKETWLFLARGNFCSDKKNLLVVIKLSRNAIKKYWYRQMGTNNRIQLKPFSLILEVDRKRVV